MGDLQRPETVRNPQKKVNIQETTDNLRSWSQAQKPHARNLGESAIEDNTAIRITNYPYEESQHNEKTRQILPLPEKLKHKEAVKTANGKGLWIFHDLKAIRHCGHKMRIGMFQREYQNDKKINQEGGGHCSRGSHPWDLQLDPRWWWKGKSVLQIQIYNCAGDKLGDQPCRRGGWHILKYTQLSWTTFWLPQARPLSTLCPTSHPSQMPLPWAYTPDDIIRKEYFNSSKPQL